MSTRTACEDVRLVFNVNGVRFEAWKSVLERHPRDPCWAGTRRRRFYNIFTGEYMFEDQDPDLFRYILSYYRTNKLHFPPTGCVRSYNQQLSFFGIMPELIDDCCYEHWRVKNAKEVTRSKIRRPAELALNGVLDTKTCRMKMSDLLQVAVRNQTATDVLRYLGCYFVLSAVICTIVESLKATENKRFREMYHWIFDVVDPFFTAVFSAEYLLRMLLAQSSLQFVRSVTGVIDLFVILSYVLNFLRGVNSTVRSILSLTRIFRTLKILQYAKVSHGVRCLYHTLSTLAGELVYLMFGIALVSVTFATIFYYFEKQVPNTSYSSIPSSFWFTIVTMTTLGYGDLIPMTPQGKLLAGVCALAGVILMSVPVTIIVTTFNRCYRSAAWRGGGADADGDDKSQTEAIEPFSVSMPKRIPDSAR
ncbi:PREDICTED: potassium voltage-gated channel protein Shal-like [Branchiostoma belcheri]|uniref:Potassium voltage-gated channel protein Shal-like n=1 Tax=Branchiostoma belcheri TaxID=7741 RepID=A0A6P4Z879_BRABE|nr:PREDICTED: potassium voltage-gated channel protein Shal-like [Branchiostoma belcheri]